MPKLPSLLLALLLGGALRAQAACPPTPEMPTAARLQAAQAQARDHGLLWQVSSADGKRRAYLYGSIHVGKLAWAIPGPRLSAALAESDSLALELDPADPELARQMRARPAPTLDAPLQQRLARQIAAACLPDGSLDRLHPLLQAMTLSVLVSRWDGLDPGYGQELVLSGLARARQWPVLSLETVDRQLDALLPGDAMEARRLTEEMLDQLEQDGARATLRRLAAAWERGDLEELAGYEQWCDCVHDEADRLFMRRLNDERNPDMATAIDALLTAGRKPFVAVGALHMTGPQGLPELLRQRGYRVERIALQP